MGHSAQVQNYFIFLLTRKHPYPPYSNYFLLTNTCKHNQKQTLLSYWFTQYELSSATVKELSILKLPHMSDQIQRKELWLSTYLIGKEYTTQAGRHLQKGKLHDPTMSAVEKGGRGRRISLESGIVLKTKTSFILVHTYFPLNSQDLIVISLL